MCTPNLLPVIQTLPNLLDALVRDGVMLARITRCTNGIDLDLDYNDGEKDFSGHNLAKLSDGINNNSLSNKIIRVSHRGVPQITFATPLVHFDGVPVALPPGGFLQASIEGHHALLRSVREALRAGGIKPGTKIADLFSGCGAFSLPLARHHPVVAFDNDAPAIASLETASHHEPGLKQVQAICRDLFRHPLMPDEIRDCGAIILDPPRAGAPAQVKQIAQSDVPVIVYASCNPKSFARDARILLAGGYHLRTIQPIDQFAHSPHIELVALFTQQREQDG